MVSLRFWNMDITLTIQIAPEGDKETMDSVYQVLDGWRQACMSMSNLIMMHLLTQENIANMFYLTEGTKVKLGNQGENSIFNTSRQNATYRIMAKHDIQGPDAYPILQEQHSHPVLQAKHLILCGERKPENL